MLQIQSLKDPNELSVGLVMDSSPFTHSLLLSVVVFAVSSPTPSARLYTFLIFSTQGWHSDMVSSMGYEEKPGVSLLAEGSQAW